ncbi:hypothetical protein BDC45DRAFT_520675 [Circinella umbellata]|nr:hypothetical protein BDC45DRAFT_520675 [Circinella umbellata]
MPNSNRKTTAFIIIATAAMATAAVDENNKNTTITTSITINDVMDIISSILLFIFSSIRTLLSKSTYIAFSPARLTYNTIGWIMRRLILLITQLTSNPVVSFILVAIGCGLLIGGCAGFAVEAFSSMLLSATWGKQTKKISTEVNDEQQEEQEDPLVLSTELNNSDPLSYKRQAKFDEFSNDEYYEEENDHNINEAVKDEKADLMHEILKRHLEQVSQEQQQSNLRRRTPVVA